MVLANFFLFFLFDLVNLEILINSNDSKSNDCVINPCLNGICNLNNNTLGYKCLCKNGYTGYKCQIKYNECNQDYCKNGAICDQEDSNLVCYCRPGYKGKYCEELIDNCFSKPCSNNGICENLVNDYKCKCEAGFTGKNCEKSIDVCTNDLCKNNGTCIEGIGLSYTCKCSNGFKGLNCEEKINYCEPNPCKNSGKCLQTEENNFNCICPCDFTGHLCDTKILYCEEKDFCFNNGQCVIIEEKVQTNKSLLSFKKNICYCLPGYYGDKCEFQYTKCLSSISICENNGTCIDKENSNESYNCICKENFSGKHCEIKLERNDFNESNNFTESFLTTIDIEINTIKDKDLNETSKDLTTTLAFIDDSVDKNQTLEIASTFLPINTESQLENFDLNTENNLFTESYNFVPFEKIFSPMFNGLNNENYSFLQFIKDPHELSSSFHLHFDFKTKESNGIIFYTAIEDDPTVFVIIFIENSLLKLSFSCNQKDILFLISDENYSVNNNQFNHVKIHFKLEKFSCEAQIQLNNSISVIKKQKSMVDFTKNNCFKKFNFGKILGSNSFISKTLKPFNGCLKEIYINNYLKLVKDAYQVKNLKECNVHKVCDLLPCGDHGRCLEKSYEIDKNLNSSNDLINLNKNQFISNFKCICNKGYQGSFCELGNCSINPCENNAICLQVSKSEINCLCPDNKFGDYCNLDLRYDFPKFKKNSYIIHPAEYENDFFEITFNFSTSNLNQENSLLAYMGKSNNKLFEKDDYLYLTLDKTLINYKISIGNGIKEITAKISKLQNLHQVKFGHSKQFFWVFIDNSYKYEDYLYTYHKSLDFDNKIYLGGHPLLRKVDQFNNINHFEGCIFNVTIRKSSKNSIFEPIRRIISNSNIEKCNEANCK